MNTLMQSLGILILLIGVAILAVFAFTELRTNTVLYLGIGAVLAGFISHIFLNRKFE